MGVGQSLHGSASLGIQLAIAQACVQLLLLALLPSHSGDCKMRTIRVDENREQRNPVAAAVESILGVCGYMVFYGVVAGALAGILGKGIGEALLLITDLPSGLATIAKSRAPMKLILQGAAVGFSGMCIISQNMNVLKELKIEWKNYLGVRLVSAALVALASVTMQSNWRGNVGKILETSRKSYAISLLVAGIAILPGLYLFSKKLFLNKRKSENS